MAAMSSTKCWAGHCHCSAGAEAAQPSRDTLHLQDRALSHLGGVRGSLS